jgi:hypothetical protein
MNENENLVAEATENVEHTTEETPTARMYSEEEVNAIVGRKKSRMEQKIRKEYERKYGDLIGVLQAGTGEDDVEALTETFGSFYESRGIEVNRKKPDYTDKDLDTLARADADEIISAGDDEVADEVERLERIGTNMTARERALYRVLAEHKQAAEDGKQLASIGVPKDVYNSADFKAFKKKFAKETSAKEIYEIYAKQQPQKQHQTMGSVKNTASENNGVKDYYSPEEARQFTKKELDENPTLYKKIIESMSKWKR